MKTNEAAFTIACPHCGGAVPDELAVLRQDVTALTRLAEELIERADALQADKPAEVRGLRRGRLELVTPAAIGGESDG